MVLKQCDKKATEQMTPAATQEKFEKTVGVRVKRQHLADGDDFDEATPLLSCEGGWPKLVYMY